MNMDNEYYLSQTNDNGKIPPALDIGLKICWLMVLGPLSLVCLIAVFKMFMVF